MRTLLMTFIGLALVFSHALPAHAQIIEFNVVLGGQFEVPPVVTAGNGSGTAVYNSQTKLLTLNVSYQDLSGAATAMHIHGPALVGQNAGVVWPLTLGSPIVDVLGPLSNAEEQSLLNGHYYINIHTAAYPAGEIRGQIENGVVSLEDLSWSGVKSMYR